MPELPEVEVLVRHLRAALRNQTIHGVEVRRPKVVAPSSPRQFARVLTGSRFDGLARRGKYLLFTLRSANGDGTYPLVGHLGMTGRMYLLPARAALPKHAAVVLSLGTRRFVFEDPRYFGRLSLEAEPLARLGPEPLEPQFTAGRLAQGLTRSRQSIKVKLLDQTLVAGLGNIYASEALFCARVSPRTAAQRLNPEQVRRLWRAIRAVLREAIRFGSTVPLDWPGEAQGDGMFYYGRAAGAPDYYEERLRVYDRAGQPCAQCGGLIRRIVQAARSTYYCPHCQRAGNHHG